MGSSCAKAAARTDPVETTDHLTLARAQGLPSAPVRQGQDEEAPATSPSLVAVSLTTKTQVDKNAPAWEPTWGSSMAASEIVALVPHKKQLATKCKRVPLEDVIELSGSTGPTGYDMVGMNMDDFIRSRGAMMIGSQKEQIKAKIHKKAFGYLLNTTLQGPLDDNGNSIGVSIKLPKETVMRSLDYDGLSTSLTLQHMNVSKVLRQKMFKLWNALSSEAQIPVGIKPHPEKFELHPAVHLLVWGPNSFKEFHSCHFLEHEIEADPDSDFVRCVALCRGIYTLDPVKRARSILTGGIFTRVASGTRLVEQLLLVCATCATTVDTHFPGRGKDPKIPDPSRASVNIKTLFLEPLSLTLGIECDDIIATWQRVLQERKSVARSVAMRLYILCFATILEAGSSVDFNDAPPAAATAETTSKTRLLKRVKSFHQRSEAWHKKRADYHANMMNFLNGVENYEEPNKEAIKLDALVAKELKEIDDHMMHRKDRSHKRIPLSKPLTAAQKAEIMCLYHARNSSRAAAGAAPSDDVSLFARSDFLSGGLAGRQREYDDGIIRTYVFKSYEPLQTIKERYRIMDNYRKPPTEILMPTMPLRDVIDHPLWRECTPAYYHVVRMTQGDAKALKASALSYRWQKVTYRWQKVPLENVTMRLPGMRPYRWQKVPLENVTMRLPGMRPYKSGGFFPIDIDLLQLDCDVLYWMDFLNHLNNPHLRFVSMQTMGTAYIAHEIEPAHLFQRWGGDGLQRLWIFQEMAFGVLNEFALKNSNNVEVVKEIRKLNDPSLQVSPALARACIEALVRCNATRESDRFHATLHSAAVRLGMTLQPVGYGTKRGIDENSPEALNSLCDDVGRYVRCCRVLRTLLALGGPHMYVSSHDLPRGLKTLGMGFVDNGEWYALGRHLKVRAQSTHRTLTVTVDVRAHEDTDNVLKVLNGIDRQGNVGGPLVKGSRFE